MSEPERQVENMQEHSDRLKDDIEDVREDWERKQADEQVPGATGEPEESEEDPSESEAEE
jgi:hypothetical protein